MTSVRPRPPFGTVLSALTWATDQPQRDWLTQDSAEQYREAYDWAARNQDLFSSLDGITTPAEDRDLAEVAAAACGLALQYERYSGLPANDLAWWSSKLSDLSEYGSTNLAGENQDTNGSGSEEAANDASQPATGGHQPVEEKEVAASAAMNGHPTP